MQEKYDDKKAGKPRVLIIFVGGTVRKELLDISVDYLTNNSGV